MVEKGQGRIFELISPKRRFIEVDRDIFGNVVIFYSPISMPMQKGIGIELSMKTPFLRKKGADLGQMNLDQNT